MFIFYLKYALIKIKLKSINIKLRAYIIKGLLLHCKIDMVTKVTSHLNRFIYVFVVYIVVAAAVAQLLLLLLLRLWRRKNLCKIFLVFLAANKLKASQGGPQLSLYVTIYLLLFVVTEVEQHLWRRNDAILVRVHSNNTLHQGTLNRGSVG